MLFASAGIADNWPDLYFRLDDHAEWDLPASPTPLSANAIGVAEPAKIGETAVFNDWEFTVLGLGASELSPSHRDFIKIKIVYTGGAKSESRLFTCLSDKDFSGTASTRIGQSIRYFDMPFQSLYHRPCLLPGAVYEG